jgi:NTE family protein
MRVGLILGGGGEVGIAWEIGVLAALEEAGFAAGTSDVIVGTSAGAIVGAYVAQGRSVPDLAELEGLGKGAGLDFGAASDGGAEDSRVIPEDMIAALTSTDGSFEERGARVGKLAIETPMSFDQATLVAGFRRMLGTDEWPVTDFRPTTVNAESGQTTLWDGNSGIGLAAAVASSCAAPGVFPPVEIGGRHYIDAPRRPFSSGLVRRCRSSTRSSSSA